MLNIDEYNKKINELLVILVETSVYDESLLLQKFNDIINLDDTTDYTRVQLSTFIRRIMVSRPMQVANSTIINKIILENFINDASFKLTYLLISFLLHNELTEKTFRSHLLTIINDTSVSNQTRYMATVYLTNIFLSSNFESDIALQENLLKENGIC